MTDQSNIPHNKAFRQSSKNLPDLSASMVTEQDGKNVWDKYFAVSCIAEGYFKGLDHEGNTLIVQTREAKQLQQGDDGVDASDTRLPDLFVYREEEGDTGTVWTEVLVAWKGKKDGYFTATNEDGHDIVIQTKAAREANFKQRKARQIAPVNFSALSEKSTPENA